MGIEMALPSIGQFRPKKVPALEHNSFCQRYSFLDRTSKYTAGPVQPYISLKILPKLFPKF
jgi:hypothetical protein